MADNRAAPVRWRSKGQESPSWAVGTRHAGCPCRASGGLSFDGRAQAAVGRLGTGSRQVSGHGKVDWDSEAWEPACVGAGPCDPGQRGGSGEGASLRASARSRPLKGFVKNPRADKPRPLAPLLPCQGLARKPRGALSGHPRTWRSQWRVAREGGEDPP